MKKSTVTIKNLKLNKENTNICVPVLEKTVVEAIKEGKQAGIAQPDLMEIRLDLLEENQLGNAQDIFIALRGHMPYLPLLATYRSQGEGGNGKMDAKGVFGLYRAIDASGCVDMVDLEMSWDPAILQEGLEHFTQKGVATLVSYHNFDGTPTVEEMVNQFIQGEQMGADLVKIAVMPQSPKDVAGLFAACANAWDVLTIPYVGISMGDLGKITRIGASTFGSCMTFAAEKNKTSAPGQIETTKLRRVLEILNDEDDTP
ncbi:type I 3-dehydroquinate dehydratase [Alkalibacter rhizosphaerae]|uniref:3-dehydroquinate dehydratase n=1 Tax=Alkalibacter rhizosphaerae TaxID=2815577 RepID=A0A974XHU9_9FIRM|nr:type I 3-dehydroquinate dehydratase [Alkalibacter rhizosphaerae]QSX08643.1 type I 3-dehydroquinate dehydratase [Alkalibacter rhizosphaerae]